jgi:EmrB/QacA subfamily drug resistance transporter
MTRAEPIYTSGRVLPFWESLWAMIGISLVNMLGALDQTIVSTALPSIVSELKGFEYYAWIVTSYLLASVVTVPVFGRLGDYFGRKPFVIAAIATFTAASALCGLAHTITFLLVARALQGIGGGMMVGTAFASIPDLFPDPHSRVRWQVVMAGAYGIGTAAGPSLGGFLSEHYSWRSAFLINVPVGIISLACVVLYLPFFRHSHSEKVRIDWGGAALVSLALGSLQLVVELLPKYGWNLFTVGLLVVVVVSFAFLLWWEKRATHPIIPLDLFQDRSLVVVFLLSTLVGFVMFSLIFYAPLLLQGGFGLSPQYAGLLVTPLAGCVAVGSILNSRIVTSLRNPTLILTIGYSLIAVSCLGMALISADTSHWFLEGAMLAGGVGMGFIFNNLNIFSQELAGRQNFGITTALIQSTRMVGGMFGTALVGTLVSRFYLRQVASTVKASAGSLPEWLLRRMEDPQILVNRRGEDAFLQQIQSHTALNGPALLAAARHVLVTSIHFGFLLTAVAALVAVWQVRAISHMRFRRAPALKTELASNSD